MHTTGRSSIRFSRRLMMMGAASATAALMLVGQPALAQVKTPTLIVQSERDQIVHPQSARYIYSKLSGRRELRWFPNSKHLICWGEEASELFRDVSVFLQHE